MIKHNCTVTKIPSILIVPILMTSTSILLFVSSISPSGSQRLWYFDSPVQLVLFIIVNLAFLLYVVFNTSKIDLYKLFIPLYFFLALDISQKFRYIYLTNPFDTTGLRGLFSDILSSGHIPSTGFYIEYAGQYNKLFVGPLHTIAWMKISGISEALGLDTSIKLYETSLKIFLYLCFLLMAKECSKNNKALNLLLITFLAFVSFSQVLTLQTYALPFLTLIVYLLIRIARNPSKQDLLLLILLNVVLVNTHSTTSLIYTFFASITLAVNLVTKAITNKSVPKYLTNIMMFSIVLFFIKFLYDAFKYFKTFYTVGLNIVWNFYEMLFGRSILNPQVESLVIVKERLSFIDNVSLLITRLIGDTLIYSLIVVSLTSASVSNLRIKNRVNKSDSILDSSFRFTALLILLITFILSLQGSLYTAFSMKTQLLIYSLRDLTNFFLNIERRMKIRNLLLLLVIVANIITGNTLFMPQIAGQPVVAYHNVNTIYKVNIITFTATYLQSDAKLSSDYVTGWQIMGYAPQLFKNYIWASPILSGFSYNVVTLLPTPDFKAGYLGEPLEYRLNYQQFFKDTIPNLNLLHHNGNMVGVYNATALTG